MVDIKTIVNDTLSTILGKIPDTRIIKVHKDNLQTVGELSFPTNFSAWKNLVDTENRANDLQNILEYYLQRLDKETVNLSAKEIDHQALELIKLSSFNKSWTIAKACLIKNRVCLFIDHSTIISNTIKQVLKEGRSFGQDPIKDKTISIQINPDFDSNLTTTRLEELKNFTENILKFQGYKITNDNAQFNALLTSKSKGKFDESVKSIVCGVVKNHETDSKEILLNFDTYLEHKLDEIKKLDDGRLPGTEGQDEQRLMRIAKTTAIFELFIRPSRPVVIGGNKEDNNSKCRVKAGAFVLYNVARIEAILRIFREKQATGTYANNIDIDNIDFSKLQSEQEWNLIWNFILGYKDVLLNSVHYSKENLELCPQHMISFLSNWSFQFSVYYHRTRILTDGNKNLESSMLARIYLLKALLIIINNALETMNLESISSM